MALDALKRWFLSLAFLVSCIYKMWLKNSVIHLTAVITKRDETRGFANRRPCSMKLNYEDEVWQNRVKEFKVLSITHRHMIQYIQNGSRLFTHIWPRSTAPPQHRDHFPVLFDKRVVSSKSPNRRLKDWTYGLTSLSENDVITISLGHN